ncbi:unnamed protein product [Pleuronectes platessa]|uniref:Uncharacterized protein n=1 Tax=Pleuronectes platessa TaxID=8262 RepID=A0A9N7Z0A4_PLEPL|nr:unnamed protein product [Pleuronectes platessa]
MSGEMQEVQHRRELEPNKAAEKRRGIEGETERERRREGDSTHSTLSSPPSKSSLRNGPGCHTQLAHRSPYLGLCDFTEKSAGPVSTFNLLSVDKESCMHTASNT